MTRSIINEELFDVLSCHLYKNLQLPWGSNPYYTEIEGKKVVILNMVWHEHVYMWLHLHTTIQQSPFYKLLDKLDPETFVVLNICFEPHFFFLDSGDGPGWDKGKDYMRGMEIISIKRIEAIFKATKFDTKRIIAMVPNKEVFLTQGHWKDRFSVIEFNGLFEIYYQTRTRVEEIRLEPRSKYFTTLNGTPRPHRTDLYNWLRIEDLLDHAHYTYAAIKFPTPWLRLRFRKIENPYYSMDFYDQFDHALHHRGTINVPGGHVTVRTKLHNSMPDFYWDDAYVHLVTETCVSDAVYTDFYTEKTMKVFDNFQIPLIMGSPRYNEFLRNKGYHMFDDLIDYGYDSIEDYREYFAAYCREVKKISQMPLANLHDYYHRNRDALEHNRELLHKHYLANYENFNRDFRNIIHANPSR